MSVVSVWSIGSTCEVSVGCDPVRAVITGVTIYPGPQIQYRVAWWSGKTRYEEWLQACEVSQPSGRDETKIGFA